jgi:MFS family permease
MLPVFDRTIFTRNFVLISLINLLIMTAHYLLFVTSSQYAAHRFHASPAMGGLTAGAIVLGCLAGRFVTGALVARHGCKKILLIGMGIFILSMLCHLPVRSLAILLLVRFVSGMGIGAVGTATGTLAALIVPAHKRGLGISYFSMSTILALAMGPFLGILLLRHCTYSTLFLLCTGTGLAGFVLGSLLHGEHTGRPVAAPPSGRGLSRYLEYGVMPFALVVLC